MLTVAFDESTMSKTRVYEWYKRFKEGREDVEDDDRPGRPSTSITDDNVEQVKKMILENRRITIREIADDVGISFGSCQAIFSDVLGMKRVAAKFVPKLLNFDQKQHRVDIAQELLNEVNNDPELLKTVITGDETWVYGYDVETKAQSSQWKLLEEPRPKKIRQVRSNVKVLLTVFFDFNGVVHHEFLPYGRTVNKEYYLDVMRHLSEQSDENAQNYGKTTRGNCIMIMLPLTPHCLFDFLVKNKTVILPQPPYSPDMAPCDFFLFPKLKRTLKG
ncbi:PREDICTED: histone-lysine N-methyltransferase SETMAR-like [Trachymyrmex septentrionalis]|uniref:histone-lysine N-methyltransferase SETMAR-like n=1 Tax=Trachymyrmex septentrionalis TaxID=34720 RepID=UPI00084F705F|nr:PREDICTED: histone-lysine N-methyltransferase SETMAR-like [Trachymyrmex septentrionalis]